MITKLTEKLFRAVKIMTAGGATAHEIADYFGISITTVNRVRGSESFEEYRTLLAVANGKKKKETAVPAVEKAPAMQPEPAGQSPLAQSPQPQPRNQLLPPPLAQSLQSLPQNQMPQQPQVQPHHSQPYRPQLQLPHSEQLQYTQPLQPPQQQLPPSQLPQPQVIEHRQTVTVQATHYMMQEMKKTNELLDLISRKLAFIVDSLT